MEAYLTHATALEFWTHARATGEAPLLLSGEKCAISEQHTPHVTRNEASTMMAEFDLSEPLHVQVCLRSSRRNSSMLRCRVHESSDNKRIFIKVREGVSVATPEYALYLLSRELDKFETIKWINAWCGRYSISTDKDETRYDLAPLTTTERLTAFIQENEALPKTDQLLWCVRHAFDNAASPREGGLASYWTFEHRYGGWNFERMQLNKTFATAQGTRRVDFYWPAYNFGIEYDSREHHGDDRIDTDSVRRITLEQTGTHILSVRPGQFRSLRNTFAIADVIARYTDKHLRITERDFVDRTLHLERKLL